jgi:DNA polymerase III sliding clamp (beta) subunit (PCNA family)
MNFTCRTEQLKSAIAMLGRVVPTKPHKEILRAVKFTSDGGQISIEGNDGENALRMVIACTNADAGSGLLEFSRLRPVVDSLIEPEVTFDIGENTTKITSGSSKFSLGCGRTEEFPAFPTAEGRTKIAMNSGEWVSAIERLEPFSVPPAAQNWRGVCIQSDDKNGIVAVASNASGGALGFEKLDARIEGPDIQAFVSERGSKLISAVLYGQPGDAEIRFSDAIVSVSSPMGEAICRLNEGKFPQWRKIYDVHANFEASCLREPLLQALTQATIPLTDTSRRLMLNFNDNTLTLRAAVASEEAEVKIPFAWDDQEFECTYSGDLLKNVVQAFPQGSHIKLLLVADEDPIRLESGAIGFLIAGMERQA